MNSHGPVVLLCDLPKGGSGQAAVSLFRGLRALGLPVELWHFSSQSVPGEGIVRSLDRGAKRPALERLLRNFSRTLAYRWRQRRHTRALREEVRARAPRLIHCHNLQSCGINHDSLLLLPRDLPLVWTLHDCGPFQPRPFEWFDAELGRADFLKPKEPDYAAAAARRKRFFAERPEVTLTAPSRWQCEEARRQVGDRIRIRHIPLGLALDQFIVVDKTTARAELGLAPERFWIGFASAAAHRRKGVDILAAAVTRLDPRRFGLVTWGRVDAATWPAGAVVRAWGMIEDKANLCRLYSACDAFVCPSRMDNFPLTVIESMACGTAVVASDRGGTAEAIERGLNGEIFAGDDPEHLAATLHRLEQQGRTTEMGRHARLSVEARYALQHESMACRQLYAELGVS